MTPVTVVLRIQSQQAVSFCPQLQLPSGCARSLLLDRFLSSRNYVRAYSNADCDGAG